MRLILAGFWLLLSICAHASTDDDSLLCGGYMGQDPPGMQPKLFARDVVSTDLGIYGTIVFTPDLTEAYWVADKSPEMWWSQLENDCWTTPEVLPLLPGYRINSPVLSTDGERLYFLAAGRNSQGMDQNDQIWYVDRTAKGWSEPVCLPNEVNGVSKHFQFSVDGEGSIYFGGGRANLYVAERVGEGFAAAKQIEGPLNTEDAEVDPCISPSHDSLIYTRFSGAGVELIASFRTEAGVWSDPISLGDLIGSGSGARFSPDGKYLFFQSERKGGYPGRSVYWVEARILDSVRKVE